MPRATTVLADGFAFLEGPRWRDGRLWVSDMRDHRVVTIDASGTVEHVADVPARPSGLGWLLDGRMLVVSMVDRRVLRREPDGTLVEHADLSAWEPVSCNDMTVGPDGRAWVGGFGFDLGQRAEPRPTVITTVDPDGTARVAADGLMFSNGMVLDDSGRQLIMAETMGGRLSAFDVHDDGTLGNRRIFAEFVAPDGICGDADGAVWAASPTQRAVVIPESELHIVDAVKVASAYQDTVDLFG